VTPARNPRPAWITALSAAILGAAVSTYLTIEHYNHAVTLACPETSVVNCTKVTTSRWSVIAGVPVAVLGLIFFVVMVILLAAPVRRPYLAMTRTVAAGVGVLTVFWLVYVELFEVDAICLWCTAVHILTVTLFVAVLWDWLAPDDHQRADS
jgi:uncharacterized membrane protein